MDHDSVVNDWRQNAERHTLACPTVFWLVEQMKREALK